MPPPSRVGRTTFLEEIEYGTLADYPGKISKKR
jgi:hypothetical protein